MHRSVLSVRYCSVLSGQLYKYSTCASTSTTVPQYTTLSTVLSRRRVLSGISTVLYCTTTVLNFCVQQGYSNTVLYKYEVQVPYMVREIFHVGREGQNLLQYLLCLYILSLATGIEARELFLSSGTEKDFYLIFGTRNKKCACAID